MAESAEAKTIIFGDKPETVEVRYGKATIVRFEAKVGSIQNAEKYEIGPLNDQQPNYMEMSVKPRTTAAVDTVNFLLADGSVARLRLVTVTGAGTDAVESFYLVKKKPESVKAKAAVQAPAETGTYSDSRDEDGDGSSKIELMKALILGSKLRGYQIRTVEKPLKTGLVGVDAELLRIYAGKELNGYVFRLTNKASQSKYEIDIRRLKIGEPNLALMSQVDRSIIEPAETGRHVAYLTIVALPSSLSRDVVLPVSWVKKEEGRK